MSRREGTCSTYCCRVRCAVCVCGVLCCDCMYAYTNRDMTSPSFLRYIGCDCRLLQGPKTDQRTVGQIREALKRQHPCHALILNYRKTKEPFWNMMSLNPVRLISYCLFTLSILLLLSSTSTASAAFFPVSDTIL